MIAQLPGQDVLPDGRRWFAANSPGYPGVEVAGRSKDKVEALFWDAITQVRADLAGVRRK